MTRLINIFSIKFLLKKVFKQRHLLTNLYGMIQFTHFIKVKN